MIIEQRADRIYFWCPGCDGVHGLSISPGRWTWNGSNDKPTFNPSLLVRGGEHDYVCHSFVRDGQIQFLGDCTHQLAGQTVDLPDWKGFAQDTADAGEGEG